MALNSVLVHAKVGRKRWGTGVRRWAGGQPRLVSGIRVESRAWALTRQMPARLLAGVEIDFNIITKA